MIYHHTCIGYNAPWWHPQPTCIVCQVRYLEPERRKKNKTQATKPQSFPSGELR
jgi:hypothetical protein